MYRTYNHRRNARNGAGQPASERLFSRARVDFLVNFLFLFFFTPLISCHYDRLVLDIKNPSSCDTRRKRHMRFDHALLALISPPFLFPFLYVSSRALEQLLPTQSLTRRKAYVIILSFLCLHFLYSISIIGIEIDPKFTACLVDK